MGRDAILWEYGSPIRPEAIAAFEQAFGVALPRSLKEVALRHDGALPHPAGVAVPDPGRASGYDVVGIGHPYRFVGTPESGWSIAEANRFHASTHPGLTFFSEAGNGWAFALDHREAGLEPTPVLVRFGIDASVVRVADGFDALLDAVLDEDGGPGDPRPDPAGDESGE